MDFDLVVLGAGAAGMMCAAVAGRRGRKVLLIEHAARAGEKIRISGGGRCNFTNLHCRPEAFLSRNAQFCRSALARYGPQDFIALVERHGIRYHEKKLGQLFCDDSAEQIITMLQAECAAGQVRWAMPVSVEIVTRLLPGTSPSLAGREAGFALATSAGTVHCRSLVIACGGLSIPKLGATPLGYRLAEQFGVPVVPPRPALVPLAAAPDWLAQFGALSGVSFDCEVSLTEHGEGDGMARAGKQSSQGMPRFREAGLVTHRGLSGPAILQISSYWQAGGGRGDIVLDVLPSMATPPDVRAWLASRRQPGLLPATVLAGVLPRRFAQALAEVNGWTGPLAGMSSAALEDMALRLKGWHIRPAGTLGYAKAEVTLGGVDTAALSQQTLEVRQVPGLYFIGEVVDVTGWLGGYNFQWAWSSGFAAGNAV